MTARVWQLVPVLEEGDAIGDHARRMARILGDRHAGFIVERAAPALKRLTTHITNAEVEPGDILVYHVALASQLGQWLRTVQARRVIDYHGITPPVFLRAYDAGLSVALSRAKDELESLRDRVELALADSDYLRAELDQLGFGRTETLPILLDFSRYDIAPNRELMDRLQAGKRGVGDILFVGRLAPNKRQENLVKAFAVYRRVYNPAARLFLVGRPDIRKYAAALDAFIERLGIEEVHVVGRVSPADLAAYYRSSDVFLAMSEHEGFGIPWLEAMYLGLPVVTYAAAAVGETVASGGLLLHDKGAEHVAAVLDLVLRDEGLRARLVEAGRRRVAQLLPERFEARLLRIIEDLEASMRPKPVG